MVGSRETVCRGVLKSIVVVIPASNRQEKLLPQTNTVLSNITKIGNAAVSTAKCAECELAIILMFG